MAMTAIQIADEEALDAGEYLELNIGGDCLHVVTTRQTTAVTLARPSTGEQACIIAEEEEGFSIKR